MEGTRIKRHKANNCIKERGSNVAYSCSLQMVEHKIETSNMTGQRYFSTFLPQKEHPQHVHFLTLPVLSRVDKNTNYTKALEIKTAAIK